MRTFGIDLASQPAGTAICLIEWDHHRATIVELGRGRHGAGEPLHDKRFMHAIIGNLYGPAPAMTAIDAPLGWPTMFAEVIAHQSQWRDSLEENPRGLLRRETDLHVAGVTGKQPLAITTERIAYAAMRANRIIAHLERSVELPVDRSGTTGVICETYPDAALRQFGLWPDGVTATTSCKSKVDPQIRRQIVTRLAERAPWLELDDDHFNSLVASDDCLDALVCALVAKACLAGRTLLPADVARASVEGWIHLPKIRTLWEI